MLCTKFTVSHRLVSSPILTPFFQVTFPTFSIQATLQSSVLVAEMSVGQKCSKPLKVNDSCYCHTRRVFC